MDRTTLTFGSLLLLLLLSLSAVSITPIVQGTETSMIWGSRFSQTSEEVLAASDACNYIINHFVWYMSYNWVYNGYGSGTTQANVYSCTTSCNNNCDHSVVFYAGHGWNLTYISGAYHYHVYADNSNTWAQGIQDSGIHSRTTGRTHYFTLIWACFQGNTIEYDHPSGGVEMPHAWTHRRVDDVTAGNQINTNYSMSDDGYGGSRQRQVLLFRFSQWISVFKPDNQP